MKKYIFLVLLLTVLISNTHAQTIPEDKILIVSSRIGLKVRHEASKNSNILGTLPYGTIVYILERTAEKYFTDGIDDYWYKIEYANRDGWIFGGYLSEGLESNPIVGEWKNHDTNIIWVFQIDGNFIRGLEESDLIWKGTYELLGNKMQIIADEVVSYGPPAELIVIKRNMIIEYIDFNRIIIILDNDIKTELKRKINYPKYE